MGFTQRIGIAPAARDMEHEQQGAVNGPLRKTSLEMGRTSGQPCHMTQNDFLSGRLYVQMHSHNSAGVGVGGGGVV